MSLEDRVEELEETVKALVEHTLFLADPTHYLPTIERKALLQLLLSRAARTYYMTPEESDLVAHAREWLKED